jgi:hypothetical protein
MLWKNILAGSLLAVGILTGATTYAQTSVHTPPPDLSCRGDQVVWVNTRSGVYHYRGERYFGSTKQGKFICEKDAAREGIGQPGTATKLYGAHTIRPGTAIEMGLSW